MKPQQTQRYQGNAARLRRAGVVLCALVGMLASTAQASRIQDLTRLKGDRPNELVGFGIVFGLKGTGDGGDFLPAMRPLQALLGHFEDPVQVAKELKNANNVAIVMLAVNVPSTGVHKGDRLNVKVSAIAAKSLKGGRLFSTPMLFPYDTSKTVLAIASGDLVLDDETIPTQATIRAGATGGATVVQDVTMHNYDNGSFILCLTPAAASFANATAIAQAINQEVEQQTNGQPIAFATDAATVQVDIPKPELAQPAEFVARIQQLMVPDFPGTARVLINSKTKTIVFSGDVELTPTAISSNGLTITVTQPNQPANPPGAQVDFLALDPAKQGGAKLQDLVDAFNLLKVSADDRITIIKQLYDAGALKCQLQVD
jgi:flagellar P-ring protein precursor FlgI